MELQGNLGEVLNVLPDKCVFPEVFGRRIGYSKPTYPGFYHVHNINDYSVHYMDAESCKEFDATLEEIRSLGSFFQKLVTHPDDLPRVKSQLRNLAMKNDEREVISYFQRIKLKKVEKDGYTLVITSVKLDLTNHTFCCISNTTDQLPVFTKKICNRLNDQYEVTSAVHSFMKLTNREREIFGLLARNKSAKEIASSLIRSVRTVEQHKKNIYKKFEIKSLGELIATAHRLQLA
ncbi:MAG: LuxR C-terminal-related transcriptional regulator [Bacteroidota bacterium]